MNAIQCQTLAELHNWLSKNYASHDSVWLVYPKKSSGIGDMTWPLLVDELLCWGWVDSLAGKVDDNYTKIRISPRNPTSNWSRVNKDKIEALRTQKRMQPSGERLVAIAKENGCWDALNDVENLIMPPDLDRIITADPSLLDKWNQLPRSIKRGFLEQLLNAKRESTRTRRIEMFIQGVVNK